MIYKYYIPAINQKCRYLQVHLLRGKKRTWMVLTQKTNVLGNINRTRCENLRFSLRTALLLSRKYEDYQCQVLKKVSCFTYLPVPGGEVKNPLILKCKSTPGCDHSIWTTCGCVETSIAEKPLEGQMLYYPQSYLCSL